MITWAELALIIGASIVAMLPIATALFVGAFAWQWMKERASREGV